LTRVLALFRTYREIFRCYTLSGKRCSSRRQGANDDFENFQILRLNYSEVLIRVEFAYMCNVFIEVSVHACVSVCILLCPKKDASC
jgi:hypothetical protein